MGNTRFGAANASGAATVANGDMTGPDRSEASPHVMERAIDGDRSTLWVAGAANQDTGTTWELVLDFGSSQAFTMLAALAVEADGLTAVKAGRYTTYPSAKSEVDLIQNGRDWGLTFASVAARYWYFKFVATDLISVGDFYVGPHIDPGIIGIPGFGTTPFRIRTEQPQTDGSYVLNDTGLMGHEFDLEFRPKNLSELAQYEALIASPGSIVLIDERDRCFEAIVIGGRVNTRRQFTGYSVSLSLERLP